MAVDPQSLNPEAQAALVLHRFGFGPRPGDIAAIASDPRGALLADLKPDTAQINNSDLPNSSEALRRLIVFRQERKAEQQAQQMKSAGNGTTNNGGNAPLMQAPKAGPPLPQRIYLGEAKAHYDAAINANIGLTERLVWFWSNHFCVSADKGPVRVLCGSYEREAIRPHVLGKFSDMLLAVETHPAMLLYLDNARSIGPEFVCWRPTRQGHQRKPRARDNGTAYARGPQWLHPGRRHQFRQGDFRLDHRAAEKSGARRRVHLQSAHA